MPNIMAPKFVNSPKQIIGSGNKKRLAFLVLILLALPVTIVLALTQQTFQNQASGPSIAKVEISPGAVSAKIGGESVHLSALAYDATNNPATGEIGYTWSISSSNTVGTLTTIDGNITEFKPLNYGCGDITMGVRSGSDTITKSITVAVGDENDNYPDCGAPSEPTPTGVITPTPTPIVVNAQNLTVTNYQTSLELEPGEKAYLMTVTSEYDQTVDMIGRPTNSPYISYLPSSLSMAEGVPQDVYIEAPVNEQEGVYTGEPEIKSVEYQAYSSSLPEIKVYLGVEPSITPSPTPPPPTATPTPSTFRIYAKYVDENNEPFINYDLSTTITNLSTNESQTNSGFPTISFEQLPRADYQVVATELPGYTLEHMVCYECLDQDKFFPGGSFGLNSTESTWVGITFKYTKVASTPTPPPPTVAPTATPVPEVKKVSLIATADAFVRGGRVDKNYGTKSYLATHKGKKMISYMKFNLGNLQGREIKKATLRFKVLSKAKSKWAPSNNTQNLKLVGNNWTERSITYRNRPAAGIPITSFKANYYSKVIDLDVTGSVNQKKGGDVSYSMNSNGNDLLFIYSRESGNQKPTLIIEYY